MNLQPTPFDLNFKIFGIHIRVHPSYWLVSAIFAFQYLRAGLIPQFFIVVACMFVSLIIHELAHALMFRAYRMDSSILLFGICGMAIPEGRLPRRSWRIIVSLAGPIVNLLVAGGLWLSNYVQPWVLEANPYVQFLFGILFIINFGWGILNLIPALPLDGGRVSQEIWMKYRSGSGVIRSMQMSIVVAVLVSAYAFACEFNLIPPDRTLSWFRPGYFVGILFVVLAVQNWFDLQNQQRWTSYRDDRMPWER
jgi:stage IV sporulation protein FB